MYKSSTFKGTCINNHEIIGYKNTFLVESNRDGMSKRKQLRSFNSKINTISNVFTHETNWAHAYTLNSLCLVVFQVFHKVLTQFFSLFRTFARIASMRKTCKIGNRALKKMVDIANGTTFWWWRKSFLNLKLNFRILNDNQSNSWYAWSFTHAIWCETIW